MMSNPLVSVVIPCYNHRKFVERCLASVANQTYSPIEVVIVDDASSDGSADEIETLLQKESWQYQFFKIQLHRFTKNQGAHTAINYGINHAQGEIISILNSDDKYYPERIKTIVHHMQQTKCEFVFSRVQYIDTNDEIITNSHPIAQRYHLTQDYIGQFPSVGFSCLISNVGISTGNFVFTKSLFKCIGQFKNYRYCHDWDFLLRGIIYSEPYFLDKPLYYYRFHGQNTFESLEGIGDAETVHLLKNIFSTLKAINTPNPLAPSPFNWPNYFELFSHWFNMDRYQVYQP